LNRKLFLIEKPSIVDLLLDNIGTKEDYYISIPSIAGYVFKEVREIKDLKHSDYEYVDRQSYYYRKSKKVVKDCPLRHLMRKIQTEKDKDSLSVLQKHLVNELNKFEEIIFAIDPDHSGSRAIDLFLINVIGVDNIHNLKSFKHYQNYYMSSKYEKEKIIDLKNIFNKNYEDNVDLSYLCCRNVYLKKDFISLYMFKRLHEIVGNVDSGFKDNYLSLNMIISLNEFRKMKYFNEFIAIKKMEDNDIGSPVSRLDIYNHLLSNKWIDKLERKDLIEKAPRERAKKRYVNEKGVQLINKIKKEIDLENLTELAKNCYNKETYESFKEKVLKI
jgi:hypothetical protein